MQLMVESYTPRRHPKWEWHETGWDCELYEEAGVIKVFTHEGGHQSDPFTRIELWVGEDDTLYYARLGRAYNERWIRRIAREFAHQVRQISGGVQC